ncbi:nucleolar MIF4G domain-containing protein 1 isoform X2 [Tamandua tetradactyla]|uniref:nucleolar MIF4G domain-containing protein 1 isoform X2 n=1 Tax=Tamandua tetradactyla TaxID=48850 RepID=UPI0040546E0A
MKRKGGRGPHRGYGSGGKGSMKRLKLAVEEFVQTTAESETPEGVTGQLPGSRDVGRDGLAGFRPGGKKSRKELKKEKRHLRKVRRIQRSGGPTRVPGPGSRGGAKETRGRQSEKEKGSVHPTLNRVPPPPNDLQPIQAKAKALSSQAKAKESPRKTRPSAAATAAARKRALLAANEEEDREIRKLERCLGLNKRKKKGDGSSVPLSFARDGLDYILGALESGKNSGLYESSSEEEEDAGQTLPESDLESDSEEESEEEATTKSEEEEEEEKEKKATAAALRRAHEKSGGKRVRFAEDEEKSENSLEDRDSTDQSLCESDEKYVPPHVKRAEESLDTQKKEELERLKKHVKGLINRLSEPNMASISGQLEELYMANSRKDMNDTLTSVLMSACVTDTVMPSRLMMEHVLLVSILHHTVGIEVGAYFLEAVVRKFDDVYKSRSEGKECDNLFTIIAHLYNFHVVQSLLIFDILKKLIGTFTEKDIELILLMLKNVGFSLRKDDALSLKELITEAQTKAAEVGNRFQDQTRVRFMLDTMLALKNNDMRKIPGYDPEPIEKLRKLQRTLVCNIGSGTETHLRVSWDSVLNAEQTGRWWIIGSSWSGAPMIDSSNDKIQQKQLVGTMTFQFSIWDKFRDLENLPGTNFSNLVHLVAHLLKTKSLPLSILKVIEFSELDKPRVQFLRKVLYMLLMETEVEDLGLIFARVSDNPKLRILREGLKLFISHFLLKNVQAHKSAEEANILKERADLATKSLQGKSSLRM